MPIDLVPLVNLVEPCKLLLSFGRSAVRPVLRNKTVEQMMACEFRHHHCTLYGGVIRSELRLAVLRLRGGESGIRCRRRLEHNLFTHDRQVITLSGDGGLAMLMGDLLSLRQLDLPVKLIVFNNSALAFVELEMKAAGARWPLTRGKMTPTTDVHRSS